MSEQSMNKTMNQRTLKGYQIKQLEGTLPMSQTMTDLKFKKSSHMPNRQVQ